MDYIYKIIDIIDIEKVPLANLIKYLFFITKSPKEGITFSKKIATNKNQSNIHVIVALL